MSRSLRSEAQRLIVGRLAEKRRAAGLTQQAVADALGRPQSYVAKVEGMERRLDVVEFIELAQAVGADPAKIVREAAAKLRA